MSNLFSRALIFHRRQDSLEYFQRRPIEEHKIDALERRQSAQMRAHFLEHHLRASLDWKSRDAGADGRKRDRLERVLIGTPQRIARRGPQIRLRGRFTQPHARGVNHVPRTQASRAGNRRLAERNWPDSIAFLLNQWAAFDANRPRVAALAGCDSRRDVRAPGTIQIHIETSPTSTDPRFRTDATSSRINELIFESLVKTDPHGEFV